MSMQTIIFLCKKNNNKHHFSLFKKLTHHPLFSTILFIIFRMLLCSCVIFFLFLHCSPHSAHNFDKLDKISWQSIPFFYLASFHFSYYAVWFEFRIGYPHCSNRMVGILKIGHTTEQRVIWKWNGCFALLWSEHVDYIFHLSTQQHCMLPNMTLSDFNLYYQNHHRCHCNPSMSWSQLKLLFQLANTTNYIHSWWNRL